MEQHNYTKRFNPANLTVMAFGAGLTIWYYQSDDKIEDITGPEYFSGNGDYVRRGDVIHITTPTALETIRVDEINLKRKLS